MKKKKKRKKISLSSYLVECSNKKKVKKKKIVDKSTEYIIFALEISNVTLKQKNVLFTY